jgi:predicted RNA-binding protein YlqC (UPF0109 family)
VSTGVSSGDEAAVGVPGDYGAPGPGNTLDAEAASAVAEDAGNRVVGAIPKDLLGFLARSIVDDPEAVVVEADEGEGRVDLRLSVAPADMGKIIGRRGRVAQAIRTLVRAAGAREGVEATVDILD